MPRLIEDYAMIGDCRTAALVARDGSIDWLCWPRFDSGACFAALLGEPDNGRWLIAPEALNPRVRRCYRENTLILETEFETADGAVKLIDFMPVNASSSVVRIVVGLRGRVAMCTELAIRLDYGLVVPWVTRMEEEGALRAVAGPDMIVLRASVSLHGEDMRTVGRFELAAGEQATFVLSYGRSYEAAPAPIEPVEALQRTESFWRAWAARCQHRGEWREPVVRSHIVLKALTFDPTGGIVAAPTTSLPEQFGGSRNWDYRYCWLRDATLTLISLMDAGYFDEAEAWRDWLLRAVAGTPAQMQIMYGVAGERRLAEWTADWLPGYEGARPVRVGNEAYRQRQLDVYGEVLDALHQARRGGLPHQEAGWALQCELVAELERIWDQPDEGIWEIRAQKRHFTHSKMMAWVALDRSIKSAEEFGMDGPLERWRALRAVVHAEICDNGFSPALGSFVQSYGSETLDASLLLIPVVGFLPAGDPRVRGTVEAIQRRLMPDGLVLRYDTAEGVDGLEPGEGAFLACSFWMVDCLALLGRADEARSLFERLLSLRNDVGLLSEEFDPRTGRQLGNFPQAFSHLALANSARNLSESLLPAKQRASA